MTWAVIGLVATVVASGTFCLWRGYRVGYYEATIKFTESNDVALCSVHHGVMNEDDRCCDFADNPFSEDDEECKRVQLYVKTGE